MYLIEIYCINVYYIIGHRYKRLCLRYTKTIRWCVTRYSCKEKNNQENRVTGGGDFLDKKEHSNILDKQEHSNINEGEL